MSETSPKYNSAKDHYESLISLFKFAIGWVTFIAIILGYITYSDGKEMREAMAAERKELHENTRELKSELSQQEKAMHDRISDNVAQSRELINSTKDLVVSTSEQAIRQISSIKDEATQTAKSEAKKSIDQVFEAKNFDEFVERVAEKRIEPRINDFVDRRIDAKDSLNFDKIVKLLCNSDVEIAGDASTYLFYNAKDLNEKQIRSLVNLLEGDKVNHDIIPDVSTVIVRSGTPAGISFTEKSFVNGDPLILDFMPKIMKSEYGQNIKNCEQCIRKSNVKREIFEQMLANANTALALSLLNSTDISNSIRTLNKENIDYLKTVINAAIAKAGVSQDQFKSSYLYKSLY